MYTFQEQLEHESRRSFLADHNLRFVMDYDQDLIRMACAYVKIKIFQTKINYVSYKINIDRDDIWKWTTKKSKEAMLELEPRIRRRDKNKLVHATQNIINSYRDYFHKHKPNI